MEQAALKGGGHHHKGLESTVGGDRKADHAQFHAARRIEVHLQWRGKNRPGAGKTLSPSGSIGQAFPYVSLRPSRVVTIPSLTFRLKVVFSDRRLGVDRGARTGAASLQAALQNSWLCLKPFLRLLHPRQRYRASARRRRGSLIRADTRRRWDGGSTGYADNVGGPIIPQHNA